jgi:hypothetical protein
MVKNLPSWLPHVRLKKKLKTHLWGVCMSNGLSRWLKTRLVGCRVPNYIIYLIVDFEFKIDVRTNMEPFLLKIKSNKKNNYIKN